MTTMLSLILAFMLSLGGSPAASVNPAGCPGDTGIQAPIDNNRTINHFSEDYNQKTASRANSKKTGKTPSINDLEPSSSIMFARFSIEKLRQASYFDHKNYRFNSVDPIINREEALVNPQLWNLYAYCRNNPITYFDPDGMDFVKYDFNLGMWESDPGYAEAKYEQQKQQIRRIYTNLSLEAISGMMLMLPPVVATGPPPYFGTGPKNNFKTPKWVKDGGSFVKWMENIQESGKTLTKAQANKIVKIARKFGVKVRLDEPHINTKWDVPHLNIGKKGQAHVKVPKGYKLPD